MTGITSTAQLEYFHVISIPVPTTTKIDFQTWKRKTIENATTTNDEQNKDRFVAIELDDTQGGGDQDNGPVIIRF